MRFVESYACLAKTLEIIIAESRRDQREAKAEATRLRDAITSKRFVEDLCGKFFLYIFEFSSQFSFRARIEINFFGFIVYSKTESQGWGAGKFFFGSGSGSGS